ncbi:protein kinase, partial [Arcobacteraceae bacterium]|nr:protein kinase [Arcobacteraceae bacterium]
MKNKLEVTIGQSTNKGKKEINQDFHDIYLPNEPQLTNKGIAVALADGISSSEVSQIASKTAVVTFLKDYYSTSESWTVKKSALRVLLATNSWLYSQSQQSKYHYDKNRGYVCTFSAMILRSTTVHILHVGDSRIYRLRNSKLEQLTKDHRLWVSKDKSYLSRALGIDSEISIDYDTFNLLKDDIYFLMTDGVFEFVEDRVMMQMATAYTDYDKLAKDIVDLAYQNGSDDNLTIQILRVDNLPDKSVDELSNSFEMKPLPPVLETRMQFDGYTIVRELSASSRSHVYLATDNDTKVSVVLKIPSIDLSNDKEYLERFMLEEWIARRLNHPNIIKSYLNTRKRNFLYTVTEYVQGESLAQWIIDNPKPKFGIVRKIIEQIAKGLQALHRQEMIHQDLRPENIMIDKDGTVKIIDFGSTRVEGIVDINVHLEETHILGTTQYAAPEYFVGEIGTLKSDMFSLGLIMYYMLSGKFSYGVNIARTSTIQQQNKLKYDSLYPSQPIWVDETLKKALQLDPYNRYDELSEFIYDLNNPNPKFINKKRPPIMKR